LTRWATDPLPLRSARCAHDLRAALDVGVTSVREPGGLGVHLARVVEEGLLEGPAIFGAGAILGTTGGHADVHGLPQAWMTQFGQWASAESDTAAASGVRTAAVRCGHGGQGYKKRSPAQRLPQCPLGGWPVDQVCPASAATLNRVRLRCSKSLMCRIARRIDR
jgi:hypothetical protein